MNINFKVPLTFGPRGPFLMNDNTADAVKENLKTTLLTNAGERLFHGTDSANNGLGNTFHKYLFSNDREEVRKNIDADIKRIFTQYFPFLSLIEVIIITPEENASLSNEQLYLSIKYSYNGFNGFKDTLGLIFNNN
jgi:hypothetical protein